MQLEYLLKNIAPWLSGDGPEADIILSSRIRLARNLKHFKFLRKTTEADRREILGLITEGISQNKSLPAAVVVELEEIGELDRLFLRERHLISRELSPDNQGAVVIGDKEIVSLMINEEDHLRIQIMRAGLSLSRCWDEILLIDSDLEKFLEYAFSPVFGYLTACPSNVGTGMRASVMIHLPALVIHKQIDKIIQAVGKLGLAVRGINGEGSPATGNIFQISNQSTLGKSEKEIVSDLEKIIRRIIIHERKGRAALLEGDSLRMEDRIYRALGLLRNTRLISSEETIDLLSSLRMGIDLGLIKTISRGVVNQLFFQTQPAHLQKLSGSTLDAEKRDALRANLIREKLKIS
ncbi:MAG: protein arginine kinase [Candidatus Auribacterota bacterium]|nr:protein arginine kinase [Candidatus Auribacterota bacterium]